ncbi:MAG: hypothetical protein V3U89_01475 [Methylophilaceae bacterium]
MNKFWMVAFGALMLVACKQEHMDAAIAVYEVLSGEVESESSERQEETEEATPLTKEDLVIVEKLGSDNCLLEFKDYAKYKAHAAFATSPDGACGWSGEAAESVKMAKRQAFHQCETFRETEKEACKVVHLDGKWQ